jgi:hypothetical protein
MFSNPPSSPAVEAPRVAVTVGGAAVVLVKDAVAGGTEEAAGAGAVVLGVWARLVLEKSADKPTCRLEVIIAGKLLARQRYRG